MTGKIGSLPFWTLTFDKDGETDVDATASVLAEIVGEDLTDLIMFSHGWNNDQATASSLYHRWFGVLEQQLVSQTRTAQAKVGVVGIFWPSMRWRDEEIPDFEPVSSSAHDTASVAEHQRTPVLVSPEIDESTLAELSAVFPGGKAHLLELADLLKNPNPDTASLGSVLDEMKAFEAATRSGVSDGESKGNAPSDPQPGMLSGEASVVFDQFERGLKSSGAAVAQGTDGTAGVHDSILGALNGAKEALRTLTYWQMKNRAGVVGQRGLGPLIWKLHDQASELQFHLVGHSFGARLVAYALAGLPDHVRGDTSPVAAVTLLEGAFSHFTFSEQLPFDRSRAGGLAGLQSRINGPLVAAFSSKDLACGKFYPLASRASGVDSAGVDEVDRWGSMGHDGAQAVAGTKKSMIMSVETADYAFEPGGVFNVDSSAVVKNGKPPSGAHSDIVHPELTWLVLRAGRIIS